MVASLGVVLAVATPSLLRAAGVEVPIAAPEGEGASAPPLLLPHPPPDLRSLDTEGALDGDDDGPPTDPASPTDRSYRDPARAGSREGTTKGALALHEQPSGASEVVGSLAAGEQVAVLRVVGDWALVYYGGAGTLVLGWTKMSGIAVR